VFICTRWRVCHHRGKAVRSASSLETSGFTCVSARRVDMLRVATVLNTVTQWDIGLPIETIP
jgi:hypothetical protein